MTVTYTINHAISPELETWLAAQPDFVSIEILATSTNVYYDHASEAEELAFKDLLADQLGLSGENVNTSDTNLLTNISITPPQLTADVDDWNPTGLEGASVIRIDGNPIGYNITGLAGGVEGRVITLVCINYPFILQNEHTSSAAANRFSFIDNGTGWNPNPNESITLRYDGISERWRGTTNSVPNGSIYGYHLAGDTSWDLGTSAGVKIGGATTDKLGFYNKTPIVQPSANADTSGATLGQLETEVNQLKALLRSLGLMAT